jgi:hypothetical protein
MFSLIALLLIAAAAVFILSGDTEQPAAPKKGRDGEDSEEWEYGDVWKQGSPDESAPEDEVRYVEILRGDTGTGYDDSVMLDLIGYLSSRGIRATYDAVPLAAEFAGAIKMYSLKVELGKEEEARERLREKFRDTM